MIDQKTTNRDYPLPHADNKLREDVVRLNNAFVDIDVDINDLYNTTGTLSSELTTVTQNIQSGTYWNANSTGNGAAYQVVLNPAPTALNSGLLVHMKAHVQNTGPATLNVNSLGIKTIKKTDGGDLKSGDIESGAASFLFYDGINFQLINPKTDQAQVEVDNSNIMRAFDEIQENHGGSLLMEAGWSDSFGNANEQGADQANSSGFQHDAVNKLYKGTDAATDQNSEKNYDSESNFSQQEWTNSLPATGQASLTNGNATVTLLSGSWPANCAKSRISFDSGSTWYDIDTRTDATNITLTTTVTEATGNFDYTIRMSEINSNEVKLNNYLTSGSTEFLSQTSNDNGRNIGRSSTSYQSKSTQEFTPNSSSSLSKIDLFMQKFGSPTDSVSIEVYTHDASAGGNMGTLLGTTTVSNTSFSTSLAYVSFDFATAIPLAGGTTYVFKVERTGSLNDTNYYRWATYWNGGTVQSGIGLNSVYQNSIWTENRHKGTLKLYRLNDSNLSNEYVSICDKEIQKTNTSAWTSINSVSITQSLNPQNAYYWLAFDPASGFGNGTEIKIFKNTDLEVAGNSSSITPNTYQSGDRTLVDLFYSVGNSQTVTQIGMKAISNNPVAVTIMIFNEDSSTQFDVLYSEAGFTLKGEGELEWFNLSAPYVTPASGTIRIGFHIEDSYNLMFYTSDSITRPYLSGPAPTGNDITFFGGSGQLATSYKHTGASPSVWRNIAKNDNGTWKYNNDATDTVTEDWAPSTVNDMLHAVSQAISAQPANRMTANDTEVITNTQWEESGGWSNSVNSIVRGVTLYSNSSTQNASVSQYHLNYDSEAEAMDLRSKTYDPGFVPEEGYVWSQIEHSDSDGPGTFYVTRNGGTEWTTVPITQQGLPLSGDIRIYRGTVDVSGQASGQDLRCRYQTSLGKDQFLHSWGLQAKS